MKISVITSGHNLDDDRVTRKQAVSLANLGHQVSVCAWRRYAYRDDRVHLVDVATLQESDGTAQPNYKAPNRRMRIQCLKNLGHWVELSRPDLMVAHEFESAVLAMRISRRLGIPYVFDAHECFEETMPLVFPRGTRWLAKRILLRMQRRVVRNSAGITAASPAAYSYTHAVELGLPAAVLHNSPIVNYFPFSEQEGDVPIVVHEGNLTFERGPLEILEALALVRKNRPLKFLILGTIPDDVLSAIRPRIAALGLDDMVDMRGRLPWTEFGEVEKIGQIGLICSQPVPNHMLSLSNKLYNYMACGLAVLGMKGSETEKIIQQYQCGIAVDTTQPSEIAKGIEWLLHHPDERRQMARNGRRAIDEHLGWHCMERVMAEFYGKIEAKLRS